MKLLLAFVLCLALLSSAFADIWTNCGTSSDLLTIDSVTITPDPPQKNANLTVTASGTLSEQVTGGTAQVVVKYGFIKILDKTEDICSSEDPLKCPIPAGPLSHTVTAFIPGEVPAGKYSGNIVLTDNNNQQIACIDVAFSF